MDNPDLRRPSPSAGWPQPVIADDVMHRLYDQAKDIAATDANVRIWGGSGIGKRTLACEIHRLSERENGPFVESNLDVLPETLIAGELFGSAASESTVNSRVGPGALESATGGTLMLRGVENLTIPQQALLFQALDERKVMRLGETVPRPIDVRVIAVGYTDPQSERYRACVRSDLDAYLGEVKLRIPLLRERPIEISILAQQFLREACALYGRCERLTFPAHTLERLVRRGWPGGVRELRAIVEVSVMRSEGDQQLFVDYFE